MLGALSNTLTCWSRYLPVATVQNLMHNYNEINESTLSGEHPRINRMPPHGPCALLTCMGAEATCKSLQLMAVTRVRDHRSDRHHRGRQLCLELWPETFPFRCSQLPSSSCKYAIDS